MANWTELDERLMRRALELARRAWGQTRPNPHVGCVIARGERVIGEGWHAQAGEAHAERVALAACTEDPRGATAYVTLEPCAHQGRTPPCVNGLLEAGIGRVVAAQRDPHPKARGGVEKLREAGVAVDLGLLEAEALLLNPAFNTYHQLGRPLITLKWAITADGCTSAASGHSKWISGEESRCRVHAMRAESDTVMVGIETALRDNSSLTIREAPVPPGPRLRRMVLDSNLRLPVRHAMLRTGPMGTVPEGSGPATIVCAEDAPLDREERLREAGAEVWRLKRSKEGRGGVSLPDLLTHLYDAKVQALLVEGGRRVAGQFFAAGCVDRVCVFVAPRLVGSGESALTALLSPVPLPMMDQAALLHHASWEMVGPDAMLSGWLTSHLFPSGNK